MELQKAAFKGQTLQEYRASNGGEKYAPRSTRAASAQEDGKPQTTYAERKRRREASYWHYVDNAGARAMTFTAPFCWACRH